MSSSSTPEPPLVDYHVHPDYSFDAQGSIDDYCRGALARGLDEICFTTHYDADPQYFAQDGWVVVDDRRQPLDQPWLHRYAAEIQAAAETFRPQGLGVKLGLEVGYFEGVAEHLAPLLAAHPFDYIIGSVHWVDGYALSFNKDCLAWLAGAGEAACLARYFDQLALAAGCGAFDCIGHSDLYRRTLRRRHQDELDLPEVRRAVDRFFGACVDNGVGIEINTRNAHLHPTMISPGPGLLALAAAAGVRTVTTGSDAHDPTRVGDGLATGIKAARAAGFDAITTFDRRRPTRHPL